MNEINLDLLMELTRQTQAELRTLRSEQQIMRGILSDAIRLLGDRIATGEAVIETRLDRLAVHVNERFDKLEVLIRGK